MYVCMHACIYNYIIIYIHLLLSSICIYIYVCILLFIIIIIIIIILDTIFIQIICTSSAMMDMDQKAVADPSQTAEKFQGDRRKLGKERLGLVQGKVDHKKWRDSFNQRDSLKIYMIQLEFYHPTKIRDSSKLPSTNSGKAASWRWGIAERTINPPRTPWPMAEVWVSSCSPFD